MCFGICPDYMLQVVRASLKNCLTHACNNMDKSQQVNVKILQIKNVEYRDGIKSKIGMPGTHSTVI